MNENTSRHLKKNEPAPKARTKPSAARKDTAHEAAAAKPRRKRTDGAEPAAPQREQAPRPPKKKKKSSKALIIVIIIAAVLALAAAGILFWAHSISAGETNLPNVYVGSTNVGGMTQAETLEALRGQQWDKSVSGTMTVKLPAGQSFRIDYLRSGAVLTAEPRHLDKER